MDFRGIPRTLTQRAEVRHPDDAQRISDGHPTEPLGHDVGEAESFGAGDGHAEVVAEELLCDRVVETTGNGGIQG